MYCFEREIGKCKAINADGGIIIYKYVIKASVIYPIPQKNSNTT